MCIYIYTPRAITLGLGRITRQLLHSSDNSIIFVYLYYIDAINVYLKKSDIIDSSHQIKKKLLMAAKFTSSKERKRVKRFGDPRCEIFAHLEDGDEKNP